MYFCASKHVDTIVLLDSAGNTVLEKFVGKTVLNKLYGKIYVNRTIDDERDL